MSCIPDTWKVPKNTSWHVQTDQSEEGFVECPVCVISVAVFAALMKQGIFLLVFVAIQSFGACLHLSAWLYNRPKKFSLGNSLFFELGLNGSGRGLMIFCTMSPWGLIKTIGESWDFWKFWEMYKSRWDVFGNWVMTRQKSNAFDSDGVMSNLCQV